VLGVVRTASAATPDSEPIAAGTAGADAGSDSNAGVDTEALAVNDPPDDVADISLNWDDSDCDKVGHPPIRSTAIATTTSSKTITATNTSFDELRRRLVDIKRLSENGVDDKLRLGSSGWVGVICSLAIIATNGSASIFNNLAYARTKPRTLAIPGKAA
jgi:hypothetical protein